MNKHKRFFCRSDCENRTQTKTYRAECACKAATKHAKYLFPKLYTTNTSMHVYVTPSGEPYYEASFHFLKGLLFKNPGKVGIVPDYLKNTNLTNSKKPKKAVSVKKD